MNTLEAITKRRSIRQFTNKPISQEQLEALLKAAMLAPTARNCQEWEFIVIRDEATRQKIAQIHPYAQMVPHADTVIIVCGNFQRELAPGYWIADCAAATQNILLAATELGLGSVWLGVFPDGERMTALHDLLKMPAHVMPLNIIALGHSDEKHEEVERFDPAKVHYEKW